MADPTGLRMVMAKWRKTFTLLTTQDRRSRHLLLNGLRVDWREPFRTTPEKRQNEQRTEVR
jgi:hypothetical protein